MLLIPDFELGLWNAWIFMIPSIFTWPFFFHLAKVRAPHPSTSDLSKFKMIFCVFSKLIFIPAVIYSFFLPLKLGATWFYVGLSVTLIGLIGSVIILINWAKTKPGKPVTKGLYRYSRHPMYVTNFVFLLGVSIITASWIFLLITIIIIIGAVVFIGLEEQQCIDHYGKTYREYMKRTSRWIGIPKSG
jgi:protein-S-isoprenylcysteine O-methyltransferase Ste14